MSRLRMDGRKTAPLATESAAPALRRDRPRNAGNQARLRAITSAIRSLNPNGEQQGEVATADPAADVTPTAEPAQAVPAQGGGAQPNAPAATSGCTCEMASGPSYSPTGSVPVTFTGGQARASFDMAASFVNDPANNKLPSCCHVRQYIKWDQAFATWRGGPPHAGFPASTAPNTWIEDRGPDDTERYGYRSGPHSVPFPNCGDEYKTGARRDMANGDRFCGNDQPFVPDTTEGQFKFQLVVYDSPGRPVARSSVISVDW
jgi:hypothetical protein